MLDKQTKDKLISMVRELLDRTGIIHKYNDTYLTETETEEYANMIPWRVCSGASKLVLFPPDEDYVIKIPFNGYTLSFDQFCNRYYEDDEAWQELEEEAEEWGLEVEQVLEAKYDHSSPEELFEPFGGEDGVSWDYCDVETVYAEAAIEEGVSEFFAITEYLFCYNDYPIYVQPKCETEYNCGISVSRNAINESKRLFGDYIGWRRLNEEWIAAALEFHGDEMLQRFFDFIEDHGINDLHQDNRGFYGDIPVLVDYSGFDW